MKLKINLICWAILALIVLTQAKENNQNTIICKEPNNVSCYMGKNEGYFCSSKDKTTSEPRWYYDKGVCRQFQYKGCYGNRNRFCTKESCEKRCAGE